MHISSRCISRIYFPRQVVGWRVYSEAKGNKPCGCSIVVADRSTHTDCEQPTNKNNSPKTRRRLSSCSSRTRFTEAPLRTRRGAFGMSHRIFPTTFGRYLSVPLAVVALYVTSYFASVEPVWIVPGNQLLGQNAVIPQYFSAPSPLAEWVFDPVHQFDRFLRPTAWNETPEGRPPWDPALALNRSGM